MGIWELADPVVSPAYTAGLEGPPNEVKLKYLADNDFAALSGEALQAAIRQEIRAKREDLVGDMSSEGTTPRQYTDLLGSLCDLTSGSGDKGLPSSSIQNYFNNHARVRVSPGRLYAAPGFFVTPVPDRRPPCAK